MVCNAVSVTDNSCTKQGNSSIFWSQNHGLYLRAVSNQERIIMAQVEYDSLTRQKLRQRVPSRGQTISETIHPDETSDNGKTK